MRLSPKNTLLLVNRNSWFSSFRLMLRFGINNWHLVTLASDCSRQQSQQVNLLRLARTLVVDAVAHGCLEFLERETRGHVASRRSTGHFGGCCDRLTIQKPLGVR